MMSSTLRGAITLALSSALLAACAAEPLVSSDTLNGTFPNGTFPNGTALHAAAGAAPLTGAGVVGSTWTGALTSGESVALRIDAATQLSGANADVWAYAISVEAGGAWYPLCGTDGRGAPHLATTSQGTWNLAQGVPGGGSYQPDAAQFTIACRGSTIAKCVEMGYKPWLGYTAELATCMRALRGDYCGDGTPYTVNGTLVNLYDDVGLQLDDQAWTPEAEWTPDGARCISSERATRFAQAARQRPWCFPAQLEERRTCGLGFDGGAAVITELPPL